MKKFLLLAIIGALWAAPSFARQVRAIMCGIILDRAPGVKEIVSGEYIFLLSAGTGEEPEETYAERAALIHDLHGGDRVCLDGIFPGGRARIFVPNQVIDDRIP